MEIYLDHLHFFIRYQPKHLVSFISNMIKRRSDRIFKKRISQLKKQFGDHRWDQIEDDKKLLLTVIIGQPLYPQK